MPWHAWWGFELQCSAKTILVIHVYLMHHASRLGQLIINLDLYLLNE